MDSFFQKLDSFKDQIALIDQEKKYTYSDLLQQVQIYKDELKSLPPHSRVAIHGDYSFQAISMFLALFQAKHTIIPIISADELDNKLQESSAQFLFSQNLLKKLSFNQSSSSYTDDSQNFSKLILFSSGSTGKPKAMIHNLDNLIAQFLDKKPKKLNMLLFLMFDHIGGINTLLHILSTGQTAIIPKNRKDIHHIAKLIEQYKISVLPTSPTFLNLLLLNQAHTLYNLSSLKMITYGTETMPQSLLKQLQKVFPKTRFLQTFGTSEVGIIQTSNEKGGSLFIKLNDPNISYKIVNKELWIKSKIQVLGYLNASMESFEDGYFKTGDLVETKIVDGEEYIKIIGRAKERINVGGEKVLPQEVEGIILEINGILDCLVYGESNAITGQSVCCDVVIDDSKIKQEEVKKVIRNYCKGKIENFKIPSKVICVEKLESSERFKKSRKLTMGGGHKLLITYLNHLNFGGSINKFSYLAPSH